MSHNVRFVPHHTIEVWLSKTDGGKTATVLLEKHVYNYERCQAADQHERFNFNNGTIHVIVFGGVIPHERCWEYCKAAIDGKFKTIDVNTGEIIKNAKK